jgi:hypothetical protein
MLHERLLLVKGGFSIAGDPNETLSMLQKKEPIPHWNQLKVVQVAWANMLAKRPI